MFDDGTKAILKLKLPYKEVLPRSGYTMSAKALAVRQTMTQNKLRALRAHAVPAGKMLNPYGSSRFRSGHPLTLRPEAMKRNRLKLKAKKAVALEAHELQALARENATAAMQTLIEISKNKRAPEATRIAASAVILDRGYGKASQTSITANVTNGKASDITSDELDKRVTSALKRVETLTNRAPKAGASKKGSVDLRKYN
jgi:hypothetical protein